MNKRVLISGASRGLGLCFAKKYLEDGCMVFAGARNEGAAGLKELKEKYGDLLVPLQLDVADTKRALPKRLLHIRIIWMLSLIMREFIQRPLFLSWRMPIWMTAFRYMM